MWAHVKGEVGRKYTDSTTLSDVKTRLIASFKKLEADGDRVAKIIAHVRKIENRFIAQAEAQESDGSSSGSESDGVGPLTDDELDTDMEDNEDADADMSEDGSSDDGMSD